MDKRQAHQEAADWHKKAAAEHRADGEHKDATAHEERAAAHKPAGEGEHKQAAKQGYLYRCVVCGGTKPGKEMQVTVSNPKDPHGTCRDCWDSDEQDDDDRRTAAESVVLNEYGRAHEKAFAALKAIGLEEGDTESEAADWASECLRYAAE